MKIKKVIQRGVSFNRLMIAIVLDNTKGFWRRGLKVINGKQHIIFKIDDKKTRLKTCHI